MAGAVSLVGDGHLPRRALGRTGMRVSAVALGTVKFGRNQRVKNRSPDGFALPSDATIHALLDLCAEAGVNLLDTAPAYGVAEQRLGSLLRERSDHFLLCTKTGETFVDGRSHYDFSRQATRESVHRSLRRLRRDALDIVLLHCPRDDLQVLEQTDALATLVELRSRGDVRAIGASCITVAGGMRAAEDSDVVMVPHNIHDRGLRPVIDHAAALGCGVLVIKALQQGFLDASRGRDPVKECLNHALAIPGVSSVVLGSIDPEHLRGDLERALASPALTRAIPA